jgi:Ca-activated chloride channel homolog
MTFGAPAGLFWLVLVPAIAFLMWNGDRSAKKRMRQLLSPDLLPALVDSPVNWLRVVRRLCLLCAFGCFVIALARPQWGVTQETIAFRGRDVMIAIDTSRSMLASDVSPSRLARAKLVAEDLIAALPNDRIGLIAFAGDADVQAPLTIDHDTVIDTLNHLDTNSVARGGTDIAAAIRVAQLALGHKDKSFRALVLLTDGEELDEDGVEAAQKAAEAGIRIFTVGVGSPGGTQITLPNGQVLRDRTGNVVISRLDENRLRSIAEVTGGFYLRITTTTASRLISDGLLHLGDSNVTNRSLTKPIERYQWPLSIGLLFLLVALAAADRLKKTRLPLKRAAAVLLLSFALGVSSRAASALDFYRNGDYEAALALWQEELKSHPHDPILNLNAGNAAYRLEKFEDAFENYSEAMNSPDLKLRQNAYYNAGNALFKAGDNEEDIERQLTNYYDAKYLYEQALDLDPNDAAAKKNLELLLQRIKEAEQQKKAAQQRQRARRSSGQKQKGQGKQSDQDQSGSTGQQSDSDENSDSNDGNGTSSENQAPTPGKKKQGDLRETQPRDANPENGQENQSPGQSKLSREEAMGLLDSLKGEEDHVNLSRQHRRENPVARDW